MDFKTTNKIAEHIWDAQRQLRQARELLEANKNEAQYNRIRHEIDRLVFLEANTQQAAEAVCTFL